MADAKNPDAEGAEDALAIELLNAGGAAKPDMEEAQGTFSAGGEASTESEMGGGPESVFYSAMMDDFSPRDSTTLEETALSTDDAQSIEITSNDVLGRRTDEQRAEDGEDNSSSDNANLFDQGSNRQQNDHDGSLSSSGDATNPAVTGDSAGNASFGTNVDESPDSAQLSGVENEFAQGAPLFTQAPAGAVGNAGQATVANAAVANAAVETAAEAAEAEATE
ncbi:hypothetical protein, partial [Roseibium sp.]|uniref:hypothetical protein n=1 Tax=Roseibium sp. TaxID=1936156 RepID=UPI003297055F